MNKILYTVCSANHLAHCKTMADSFVQHNTDYKVIIGLVDKVNGRFDVAEFLPYLLVEVDMIGALDFETMAAQYTIIELNCAMKSFMAQYIFKKYCPDILLYLDSDMWVLHDLAVVEDALFQNDILITPHFMTPMPDGEKLPLERDVLRSGIYNAGFIGFRKSETVDQFLQWWSFHMQTECHYNFAEGMAVDQVWLNLAPLFFKRVGIFDHKGANVAYWNLHERSLSFTDNKILVNESDPLLFLHISGYKFDQPENLSRHQTRFELGQLPVLKQLLAAYRSETEKNGYSRYVVLTCAFAKTVKRSTGIMKTVNKWLKPLGVKLSSLQI